MQLQVVTDEPESNTLSFIAQEDAIKQIANHGYEVTERTLTYWRQQGKLQSLTRLGNFYVMPESDIAKILILCGLRKGGQEEITSVEIEGKVFYIKRIEILRLEDKVYRIMHTTQGGLLVKELDHDRTRQFAE